MKWNKQFIYPESTRSIIHGKRHYDVGEGEKLPSVTTILSATQPEEKKRKLAEWQQRVGKNEAERIRDSSAERGTIMHRILEGYLTGHRHADLSDVGQKAGQMAKKIWEADLRDSMDEVWGTEVTVYYPGLYAGATDLVGVYNGAQIIGDFKQSNKPKQREWIEDYFLQLAAYGMAHNAVYGTSINSGVVLMCTPELVFQRFFVTPKEYQSYMWKWLKRVDLYYKNQDSGIRGHENI